MKHNSKSKMPTFVLKISFMLIILFFITGCGPSAYHSYIVEKGYIPYSNPRNDFGPGLVFEGKLSNSAMVVDRIICSDVFPTVAPTKGKTVLPGSSKSGTFDSGIALNLLDGMSLIKNVGDAEANLSHNNIDSVTISFTGETNVYYRAQDTITKGKPRPIQKDCFDFLQTKKKKGELPKNIYIVDSSLLVEGINYNFTTKTETEGGLKFSWKKLLNIESTAKNVSESGETLIIKEQLYVGAGKIFRIKDWAAKGQVTGGAGEMGSVIGEPITLSKDAIIKIK